MILNKKPAMPRMRLWRVATPATSPAVVRAADEQEAWAIVAALTEHGDLSGADTVRLEPVPPAERRTIVRKARMLGVQHCFLAMLPAAGAFITRLGALAAHSV